MAAGRACARRRSGPCAASLMPPRLGVPDGVRIETLSVEEEAEEDDEESSQPAADETTRAEETPSVA